jgi:hypothetical protein
MQRTRSEDIRNQRLTSQEKGMRKSSRYPAQKILLLTTGIENSANSARKSVNDLLLGGIIIRRPPFNVNLHGYPLVIL